MPATAVASMSILPGVPAVPSSPPPPPAAPAPYAIPAQPSAGNVCPVCHSADALRRVSNIIDSGQSKTKGQSDSVNLDTWDVTLTNHSFTTRGQLGDRFAIPNKPKDLAGYVAGGAFVGLAVLMAMISSGMSEAASEENAVLMALFATLLGPVLAAGCYYAFSGFRKADEQYKARTQQSRLGYYCARDDVAFLAGGPARSPESYAQAFALPS